MPLWYTNNIHLFGLIAIIDALKGGGSVKCWGLIATCTRTRLLHVEITENCGQDSMIIAIICFLAEQGMYLQIPIRSRFSIEAICQKDIRLN